MKSQYKPCKREKKQQQLHLSGSNRPAPIGSILIKNVNFFDSISQFQFFSCVYSKKRLPAAAHQQLDDLTENVSYVCGASFVPEDHTLATVSFNV